jgi:hypothetical protein
MRARPEELRVVQETLYLPVEGPDQRLDLEFRVLGYGASPTFTSGRNLGTSVAMDTGFADALAELIAAGSKVETVVEQSGWRIVRGVEGRRTGSGFRLERHGRAIDITIAPMGADEPAFVKHAGLGMVYSVPHDREDPTKNPALLPFVQKVGKYLLHRLAADPRVARARAIDMETLRQFAMTAVDELEGPYSRELDFEPLHDMAQLGRRHGDKFSRVAAG